MKNKMKSRRSLNAETTSPAKKSKTYIQYRNHVHHILDVFDGIGERLTEHHKSIMDKTPFSQFFKALVGKRICGNRRRDEVLGFIIRSYNSDTRAFRIGDESCKVTELDVKLIFGIEDGETRVDISHREKPVSEFASRVFPNVEKPTRSMMKAKVAELVGKVDGTSVEDTVRLLILLLFQSCFFTTTGQCLAWAYIKYVDKLDSLKLYNWSAVILQTLMKGLDEHSREPHKVVGCTFFLMYWFCEHYKLVKGNYNNTSTVEFEGIPRCVKWDVTVLDTIINKPDMSAFTRDRFCVGELEPTAAEMELNPSIAVYLNSKTVVEVGNESDFVDSPPVIRHGSSSGKSMLGSKRKQKSNDRHVHWSPVDQETVSEEHDTGKKKGKVMGTPLCGTSHDSGQVNGIEAGGVDAESVPVKLYDINMEAIEHHEDKFERMSAMNDELRAKVKGLEEEKLKNESIITDLTNEVKELEEKVVGMREARQQQEMMMEDQRKTIEELRMEISKMEERCVEDTVHAVTQFASNYVPPEEEEDGEKTWVRRMKNKERKPIRDPAYIYPDDKKGETKVVGTSMEKVTVIMKKKKADYPFGDKINNTTFQLVKKKLNGAPALFTFWTGENKTAVTALDIVNFMEGKYISGSVIDAFGTLLSRDPLLNAMNHIFPANTWALYERLNRSRKNFSSSFIKDLKEAVDLGKQVLIPLCCPGRKAEAYHWTLLTYAPGETGEWYMHNPIRARVRGTDHFMKNAIDLRNFVWKFLHPNGAPELGEIVTSEVPLQESDSADCAVYVMYYMYQLIRNQPINVKWKGAKVKEFKAFILESIACNGIDAHM